MAADGGGNFGGDGSVNWKVITGKEKDNSHDCKKDADKRRDCHGADDDFGPNFRISIKIPKVDGETFLRALRAAAVSNGYVNFELPIEDKEPEQIVVRWGTTSASEDPTAT